MNLIFNFLILNDYPEKWQLSFQDPATSIMENIIDLHHDIMFFLIIITVLTLWMLFRIITLFNINVKHTKRFLYLTHNNFIEIFWTIIPTIILFLIALPSYTLIYNLDNLNDPLITLKIIGHQWYWTYEYPDLNWDVKLDDENNVIKDYLTFDEMKTKNVIFDSYMIAENDIENSGYRLLDVDNYIVLPIEINVRLIITAADVIHSWTIPSLGVKLDATPGRLNQVGITVLRTSYFYGQCSELCGLNHSFMPIALKTVNSAFEFEMWLIQKNDWFGKNII